jgi:hypothetical protein
MELVSPFIKDKAKIKIHVMLEIIFNIKVIINHDGFHVIDCIQIIGYSLVKHTLVPLRQRV